MDKTQQYERVFNHFDENKDGKISPFELHLCLGSIRGGHGGGEISPEEAEAVVVLMDSDGDGFLGVEDFVRFIEGAEEEEKLKDLKEAFKMYEMEESGGNITPKSLKRMLSKLGEKKSIDECKFMIDRYDINGDGVLNFDEFLVMMA